MPVCFAFHYRPELEAASMAGTRPALSGADLALLLQCFRRIARDEASASAEGEVAEHPLGNHERTILQVVQIEDMDNHPDEPGKEPVEVLALHRSDRLIAADGRQATPVLIAERLVGVAGDGAADVRGGPPALLHGGRSDARNRLALGSLGAGGVA